MKEEAGGKRSGRREDGGRGELFLKPACWAAIAWSWSKRNTKLISMFGGEIVSWQTYMILHEDVVRHGRRRG